MSSKVSFNFLCESLRFYIQEFSKLKFLIKLFTQSKIDSGWSESQGDTYKKE